MANFLSYEEWCDEHEDELAIEFSETGIDRELFFDPRDEIIDRYHKYEESQLSLLDDAMLLSTLTKSLPKKLKETRILYSLKLK